MIVTPHLEVIEQDSILCQFGRMLVVHYPAVSDIMAEQFCVFRLEPTEVIGTEVVAVLQHILEDLPKADDPEGKHRGNAVRFAVYWARRMHREDIRRKWGRTAGRMGPVHFIAGQCLQLPPRGRFTAGAKWFVTDIHDGSDGLTYLRMVNCYTQNIHLVWDVKRKLYGVTPDWQGVWAWYKQQEVQQALQWPD